MRLHLLIDVIGLQAVTVVPRRSILHTPWNTGTASTRQCSRFWWVTVSGGSVTVNCSAPVWAMPRIHAGPDNRLILRPQGRSRNADATYRRMPAPRHRCVLSPYSRARCRTLLIASHQIVVDNAATNELATEALGWFAEQAFSARGAPRLFPAGLCGRFGAETGAGSTRTQRTCSLATASSFCRCARSLALAR
jgi:hypothetical protein